MESVNSDSQSTLFSNRYFSNTAWLITERVLRVIVATLVGAYVARYLGPQRFGVLSFAQSYLAVFITLATLGLDGIVVRELVNNPHEHLVILGSAFALKLFASALMWVVLAVSFLLFQTSDQARLLVTVLAIGVIFQSYSVISFYFQAKVESKYVAKVQLVQLGISSILKIVLVSIQADLVWFAAVIAVDNVFVAFGLYAMYRAKTSKRLRWSFQIDVAKRLLIHSLPLMIYSFFVVGLMNVDQIMIKGLLGNAEVGWYAAAVMISSVWYFIPVAVGSTFNPFIISQVETKGNKHGIELVFSSLFVLSVLGAFLILILAPVIIRLLFGSDYQPAASVLSILILNGIFVFHVSIRTRVLIARKEHWVSAVIMFGALILNVFGNFILIPRIGIQGAAWSSVIAWGVAVVVLPVMFPSCRQFVQIFVRPRFSGLKELVDAIKS